MLLYDSMYESIIGKLVLYSETFGATTEIGAIIKSKDVGICIYWFAKRKKEFMSQKMFKNLIDDGFICFADGTNYNYENFFE